MRRPIMRMPRTPPRSPAHNNETRESAMQNTSLLALALVATLPFAANAAEGVSYNYVQGGYTATNTDGADADGLGLDGSVAIAPNFHLFGGYSNQEIDN